jgi:peroxiredoxin Q/BCP
MSPAEGATAPAFEMPANRERTVSSRALHGKPYVLYFYPKADTSGCTTEACGFQEALAQFDAAVVTVIGVSRDTIPALEKFAAKYSLSFPLASDQTGSVCEAFGTWVEKSMYGRKYMGIERATFLVNNQGKLARVWRKVKTDGHAAEVLAAARALG